jgi:hypothetical protein
MGHPDTMAILGIIVIRTIIAGITMRLPTGLAGQIRIRTGKAESLARVRYDWLAPGLRAPRSTCPVTSTSFPIRL